jgi:inhibitor of KinA sporulation pathway (predicted exonuclease)
MRYVVVDLEATCWNGEVDRSRSEIIEIGAVLLGSAQGEIVREFSSFIRPVLEPKLSDFCRQLTTITQEQVDQADSFPAVFPRFVDWIGDEPFFLCSWGAYDLNQFRLDCTRHEIELPETFERHINLKKEFSRTMRVRPCGMSKALRIAKLQLEGTHHRGIDDAKNIAKLARLILPRLNEVA